jgi:hypothetical protein
MPRSQKYKRSVGTAKPARHLRNHHSKKPDLETSTSRMITGMNIAPPKFYQQQLCQKVADDLLLLSIMHSNISFSTTCDDRFQALIQYLNHDSRIPRAPTTVKLPIIARFSRLNAQVADQMKQATTQFHLSCEGWTCPEPTMAVIG